MPFAKALGQQDFERLADDFSGGMSEDPFRSLVEHLDSLILADGYHRLRGDIEDSGASLLGRSELVLGAFSPAHLLHQLFVGGL